VVVEASLHSVTLDLTSQVEEALASLVVEVEVAEAEKVSIGTIHMTALTVVTVGLVS
jgi:hypothetical protein